MSSTTVSSSVDTAATPEIVSILERARVIQGWYPEWQLAELHRLVQPYAGKRGLEIGTWHGRSAVVLAASLGHLVCVDTWAGLPQNPTDPRYAAAADCDIYAEAERNLQPYSVELVQATSSAYLRLQPRSSFDVIHIDGDHSLPVVGTDVYYSWCLLRPGGLLCGDDYDEPDVQMAVARIPLKEVTIRHGRLWYAYV